VVSIEPNINYARTEAEFNFKIGIEKRAIQLSPEKTQERIESLNETLAKWRGFSENLGKVVKGLKTACLGTGLVLTVKNFLDNGIFSSGKGIARQKVMRNEGGWVDKCWDMIPEQYDSLDACFLDNSGEIGESVDAYVDAMEEQSKELEELQKTHKIDGGFLGEDILNTDEYMEDYIDSSFKSELQSNLEDELTTVRVGSDDVLVSNIIGSITPESILLTQARDIQLNSRLLDSENEAVRELARDQIEKDLGDVWVNSREVVERIDFATKHNAGEASSVISTKELKEVTITEVKTFGDVKDQYGGDVDINDYFLKDKATGAKEYLLVLDNDHVITQTYLITGAKTLIIVDSENANPLGLELTMFDETTYENTYKDPEIRYYETEPYQGLPAIVPFDLDKGWYAAIKSTIPFGGAIKAYDDSGRVSSFYLCNVGINNREEFDSGIGDDICEMINLGTGQPYNQFPGLKKGEASALVNRAVSAIQEASTREYMIDGQRIKVGEPYLNIPDIQCQDFMSPMDCNILFNVCDPVICPSSRCDLDGTYPVKDVIQSGIFGSLALCLPNFPEVKVPICLSGVHAGIEGYLSVMDSYQQCLQTSLDTGETVGICDEVHSIYMCEFLWRQGLPLAKIAVPRLLGSVMGQNVRGGGEYLGVADAWQKAEDSVDYFTQYYAANSYKAFKARSAEGVGGEICKNYVSFTSPQGGNLLDALTNPDSPPQYHGWFDEIPFTTATNPPISQYKVFYHIYAGKDSRAYYQVYLRDPSGGSFYQDTAFRRMVATGFIGAGEYASETRDFTAPSGYKEMCIVVNGWEECGFKIASTSFAVNYVKDQYVAEQARQTDITSETACISGTPSLYSFFNPNFQSGLEDAISPAVYNSGIIRICATDNPGKGTDAFADDPKKARWREVGYCGNTNIKCWLDSESVTDAVRMTSIEDEILGEVTEPYVEQLKREGGYLNFEVFLEELEGEEGVERINLITENYQRAFYNSEKAYLLFLRGGAYKVLALEAYNNLIVKQVAEEADKEEKERLQTEERLTEDEAEFVLTATSCEECGETDGFCDQVECNALGDKLGCWFQTQHSTTYALPGGDMRATFVGECTTITSCDQCSDAGGVLKGLNGCNEELCSEMSEALGIHCEYIDRVWPVPNKCVNLAEEKTCGDCGEGWFNRCDEEECGFIGEQIGVDCRFVEPNKCIAPEEEGEPEPEALTCDSPTSCREVLGEIIIGLAQEEKVQQGISDTEVKQDTGAESFECLVLQVAYQESGIVHCKDMDEHTDPLYCEGNSNKIIVGDYIDYTDEEIPPIYEFLDIEITDISRVPGSTGIMQVHLPTHGSTLIDRSIDISVFRENVGYALELLRTGHARSSKEYACKSTSYSGWQRALRKYNGWNTDCTKGDVDYVETIIGRKDEIVNLFEEECA
jgi:hypothetical protein